MADSGHMHADMPSLLTSVTLASPQGGNPFYIAGPNFQNAQIGFSMRALHI
jgi:hypothetical protein